MIEKTAWDVRKYPEKFAVYRILCNFAVVFQNCINSMEAKYIHRELSAVIEEAYRYFSVITVTGPRQSGKTTLLRNLFSYLPYYSLENTPSGASCARCSSSPGSSAARWRGGPCWPSSSTSSAAASVRGTCSRSTTSRDSSSAY